MKNKIKNKLIKEFGSLRFWLINLGFLILGITLFLLSYFYKNSDSNYARRTLLDSISFSSYIVALVSILFIVFKLGFLSNVIKNFKEGRASYKKAAEERKLKKMTPKEKEVYLKLQKKDLEKKQNQPKKTLFPFIFVFLLYGIPSIVFIIIALTV
ncbi:DUF3899 domain-containing protein [Mycoplasma sp. NEAQ87857]|uniref:DUF3899 domain-containing protein n=1 Tax=Mycoplasma sp. NEAQ87857 TaxID=2683967 RepID=UPI001318C6DC|nr:DUF3899 domain-containing protein [Mycoplasma sp. NEAQ87857]QGZ97603.1 DUF3899 domain-containing protein [Mycoplasma sp. NEAQ87857]